MSMRLPKLRWRFIAPTRPLTTTAANIIANFKSQIVNSCQYWQLVESPNTGTNSLLIKPSALYSTSSNMNVVICSGVTGSLAYQTPDDPSGNAARLHVGLTPDVTQNGSGSFSTFQSATPFGPNPRWSKYWHIGVLAQVSATYIIESEDSIWLGIKDNLSTSGTFGALVGNILESPDSGSGENNFRLYGMMTSGISASISTVFWAARGSLTSFMDEAVGTGRAHTGIFLVSGGQPNMNPNHFWTNLVRANVSSPGTDGMVDWAGSPAGSRQLAYPVFFCTSNLGATANAGGGTSRGFYYGSDDFGLVRIQSGGIDQVYKVGSTHNARNDAFVLGPASGSGL